MYDQIRYVLDWIMHWHKTPGDAKPITSIDIARRLPPPEISWALLWLIHYRLRKIWAWRVFKERLRDRVKALPTQVTIQDVLEGASDGIVPGMPEWGYHLDGNGSYLANRATGEQIRIDILNGPGVIGSGDFLEFVTAVRQPGPAQERLLELFPSGHGLMVAMECLSNQNLFHHIFPPNDGPFEFELCDVLRHYAKPIQAFLTAWEDMPEQRLLLGSLIGDWPAVKQAADSTCRPDVAARAEAFAVRSHRRWLNLVRVAADSYLTDDALHTLVHAKADDLPEYVAAALADPCLAASAIEMIEEDASYRPQVAMVFAKAIKDDEFCDIRGPAARYLARHGCPVDEILPALVLPPVDMASAICLAIDYAPHQVGCLLPCGLRSKNPDDRLTAAAVLAIIDNDWSRRELLAALTESADLDATIECRCALRESREPAVCRAAECWEEDHPDSAKPNYATARGLYEFDGGCERVLRERMQALHDRVVQVRSFLPRAQSTSREPAVSRKRTCPDGFEPSR